MITFEDAYLFLWLAGSAEPYRYLSFTANQYRERIEAAWADGNIAIIPMLIDGIMEISRGSTDLIERAEIYLICARFYFNNGEYASSRDHLDEANQVYMSDPFNQAVVYWMKGCVLWQIPGHSAEAIQFWQRSLGKFIMLSKNKQVPRQRAEWYQVWGEEMKASIEEAILIV